MDPSARRELVRRACAAAVASADAGPLLGAALDGLSNGIATLRTAAVIAAGKAAARMLEVFLERSSGPSVPGVLSAPAIRDLPLSSVESFRGGHPGPNAESAAAGRRALELARQTPPSSDLVVLLSGGASALLAAPAGNANGSASAGAGVVTLDEKITLTRLLIRGGAAIDELNCVRKHLSAIKGGQLAIGHTGRTFTFALSDVTRPVDDDPATIGSGPTVADPSTYGETIAILDRIDRNWRDRAPGAARRLDEGRAGRVAETPKPGDPRLARSRYVLIGNRHVAARAASDVVRREGVNTLVRARALDGEARQAAVQFVDEALEAARHVRPFCYVGTGETTVRVVGRGHGGRNQEFVLAACAELSRRGLRGTVASVGTDGIDGASDAAGAVGDEFTLSRASATGRAVTAVLDDNDSYTLLSALGDTIVTGPTGTNVGDMAMVLVV